MFCSARKVIKERCRRTLNRVHFVVSGCRGSLSSQCARQKYQVTVASCAALHCVNKVSADSPFCRGCSSLRLPTVAASGNSFIVNGSVDDSSFNVLDKPLRQTYNRATTQVKPGQFGISFDDEYRNEISKLRLLRQHRRSYARSLRGFASLCHHDWCTYKSTLRNPNG